METVAKPKTIDEFISTFPENTQEILNKIREMIKKTAPEAEETISYGIPTFKLNGTYLIYFSAYKTHIGLYPIPHGSEGFMERIETFKAGKGTLQFPLKNPMPWNLINEIVENSLATNLERTNKKAPKKNKAKQPHKLY